MFVTLTVQESSAVSRVTEFTVNKTSYDATGVPVIVCVVVEITIADVVIVLIIVTVLVAITVEVPPF